MVVMKNNLVRSSSRRRRAKAITNVHLYVHSTELEPPYATGLRSKGAVIVSCYMRMDATSHRLLNSLVMSRFAQGGTSHLAHQVSFEWLRTSIVILTRMNVRRTDFFI